MSDAINPDHYKQLPVEAIEIIEAMIAGAPDNKAAYLHGQAAKYDLRLRGKGKSLEDYLTDWQKRIWYALRLESHLMELIEKQKADEQQKAADLQSLKDHPFGKPEQPAIKQSLAPEPPDGWRFLEVGEVIRKGDKPVKGDAIPLLWIGTPCCNNQFILRRSKFELGEKVVHGDCKSLSISVVENILGDGWVDLVRDGVSTAYHVKDLAPYIEDAT